jgi:hypothetical protein
MFLINIAGNDWFKAHIVSEFLVWYRNFRKRRQVVAFFSDFHSVAEFIDPWLRDKINSGIGLLYRLASHVAWRVGTKTLCLS